MPTHFRDDGTPVVQFNPLLEVSPFDLFQDLREGRDVLLVDVRPEPGRLTLSGAESWPGDDWEPPGDRRVVLFDDDGSLAVPAAHRLLGKGFEEVKALFGGLDLYEFSLDPEVVGEETFLLRGRLPDR